MSQQQSCPKCGKTFSGDTAGGACPSCMMAMALPPTAKNASANGETIALDGHFYAPRPDELTEKFPNLEILELLGHGGMGAVYRARQINLDRIVALKVLSPRLGVDPSFAERFAREAKTLAKLNHPNIVTVFDFGQAGELYYLIMELVEGVNLRDAIQAETVPPQTALAIVPQVCEALQYAHDHGVVHRDIKPENILIGDRNQVKIADFGLSKMLSAGQTEFTLTGTHQIMGTRNYMAPEQIEKPLTVDHRADIYSLGVVFYELLTGELPLGRFSLPSEKAQVNGQLDDVVLRTLEKEPDRRYQHASQVKTAVESIELSKKESPIQKPPRQPRVDLRAANVAAKNYAATNNGTKNPVPLNAANRISMPFKIEEIHGGLSELHGIAHSDGQYLQLEFRTHTLGVKKSKVQVVQIPASQILRATVTHGIFSDSIEFQSGNLETFDEVPGSVQGKIKLVTEKKNSNLTEEFASHFRSDRFAAPIKPRAHANDDREMPTSALAHVPFKITDVHGGFSEAFGIAKVNAVYVLVEFEIKDGFGITKSSPKHVAIPITDIISIDLRYGIFSDKIEIQTAGLDAVSGIPTSTQGKFAIKTKKSDQRLSEAFVRQTASLCGLPVSAGLDDSKPPTADQQRSESAAQRLRWPARALFCVALFNLVVFCLSVSFGMLHILPSGDNNKSLLDTLVTQSLATADNDEAVALHALESMITFVSRFSVVTIVPVLLATLLMALLQIFACLRIRSLDSYHLVTATAILAALPIHPGFLLGLPVGLWLLTVLLNPDTKRLFDEPVSGDLPQFAGRRYNRFAMFRFSAFLLAIVFAVVIALNAAMLIQVMRSTTTVPPAPRVEEKNVTVEQDSDNKSIQNDADSETQSSKTDSTKRSNGNSNQDQS